MTPCAITNSSPQCFFQYSRKRGRSSAVSWRIFIAMNYVARNTTLDFLFRFDFILRFPDPCGPVGKEYSVQVIDLVLEDARQPALCLDLHRLTVAVQSFYLDRRMTLHLPHQPGDGETAFHTHDFLFGSFDDLRIYNSPYFLRCVLLIFVFSTLVIFDDDETLGEADLRRSQAHPRGVAHGFDHVVDQGLQIFIDFRNRMSFAT